MVSAFFDHRCHIDNSSFYHIIVIEIYDKADNYSSFYFIIIFNILHG